MGRTVGAKDKVKRIRRTKKEMQELTIKTVVETPVVEASTEVNTETVVE